MPQTLKQRVTLRQIHEELVALRELIEFKPAPPGAWRLPYIPQPGTVDLHRIDERPIAAKINTPWGKPYDFECHTPSLPATPPPVGRSLLQRASFFIRSMFVVR